MAAKMSMLIPSICLNRHTGIPMAEKVNADADADQTRVADAVQTRVADAVSQTHNLKQEK